MQYRVPRLQWVNHLWTRRSMLQWIASGAILTETYVMSSIVSEVLKLRLWVVGIQITPIMAMMTLSNEYIFRVSGHLCGEFTGQRPLMRSFEVFPQLCLNKRLSKQSRGLWFETPSCSLWRHCNTKGYLKWYLLITIVGTPASPHITYSELYGNIISVVPFSLTYKTWHPNLINLWLEWFLNGKARCVCRRIFKKRG